MRLRLLAVPVRKLRKWFHPAGELARLVKLAHLGTISLEEFSSAPVSRGRALPLVKAIADLLLDLKQQRAEHAALQQELRDRIANRTDALQRKIGSLQLQANRDALTGLGNRRGLDADLSGCVDRYRSQGTEVCLLMIDVDHFKPLNDTLGHPAGDQLLKDIAQLIRSTLRGEDQAYRCGGDEFIVVLQDCSCEVGQAVARRLESLVTGLTKSLKVNLPPQLSIGTCALSELKELSAQSLLQTADARLYQIKSAKPRTRRSA